jgi:hypothetical protein
MKRTRLVSKKASIIRIFGGQPIRYGFVSSHLSHVYRSILNMFS